MPAAIPLFWAVSTLAAYLYGRQQGIPSELLWAALPAFLLEATLYLLLGLESARRRLEALPFTGVAVLLTFFGVLPYAAATFALGVFDLASFAALLALAALLSFWYIFLPPRWSSDLAFLVVMVTAILSGVVRQQYPSVHPRLPLSELGHVMWFRTGIAAILMVRKVDGLVFGFWPTKPEWRAGVRYFTMFVPLAAVLAWAIGFGRLHVPNASLDRVAVQAIGTFFGFLWVVGLAEEFFFRGLLQAWVAEWLGNQRLSLGLVSAAFGSVHLWFKPFPNWRFAIMAALAGVFYGLAFQKEKSVRASAVTHALTVTVWRLFVA